MGISPWRFGGVVVVDRVVNVVFRQSLFWAQEIRHTFRIYFFPFWEMLIAPKTRQALSEVDV